MRKLLPVALVSLALLLAVSACTPHPVSAEVIQSNKARESPTVPASDLASLVNGNNTFAFNLYQALRQNDGNLFFSPYSISVALAMTYAGASGATQADMAKALSFVLSQDKLHPAFNSLDLALASRGKDAKGTNGQPFQLHVANAIWGQRDYPFLTPFIDTLGQNYGAGLRTLDFIKSPEPSRITINDWVDSQTNGRIKDLVPKGSITDITRMVLTNAIYFNAAWLYQFKKESTADGPFTLLDGSTVTLPLMKQVNSLRYADGTGYQAVEMPYDGGQLSMVLLVPQSGQFGTFEKSLDAATVAGIIGKLQIRSVTLTMPRFKFDSSFGLKQPLTALGMGQAFTDKADFSGMDGRKDLFIQDVIHKAFVAVDEEGTEAAAATAVIVGTTAMPQPAEVKIDRPFIFLIRDNPTGTTLFAGRVLNPTK